VVELYTPHSNQEKIHQAIKFEPYKYYVLNIGRQFGKSLLAENQILDWGLSYPGCKIGWVSPIYRQAKKVFDDLDKAIYETPICKARNKQDLEFTLSSGSTIQFFSSERYDNIRGFTFDFLVCDEFAFMDEQAWSEVLRATVLVHGKKVLLISTPRGKNHFYNIYNLESVNPQYKSFTMTSYDNPIINPSEIDDARRTLPDHVFRQEYLAEFIDGGTSPFIKWQEKQGENTNRLYFGLDLGRADDYTVLTIVNEHGDMVFCDRWRQMSWDLIIANVGRVLNQFQPQGYIEVNSIGDAIYEQVCKIYTPQFIQPFVTTSKSKQDIIEQLIVANQHKEATIMPIDWLKKEYDVFTYEYNPKTKNVRYAAASGFHDDGVMGHALAYEAMKKLKLRGEYNLSFI
jgi:hypothetical protein